MKKLLLPITLLLAAVLLTGCVLPDFRALIPSPTEADHTEPSSTVTTPPETETSVPVTEPVTDPVTEPETEPTPAPVPEHSDLYIPGVSVESVILYFNEVCLDAEFVNNGDASLLQKWTAPIRYYIYGKYTDQDMQVLTGFTEWLNTIEGFPGIAVTTVPRYANMSIHFCTRNELLDILGDNFYGTDGGVTFWYANNAIYDATICYRTDLNQTVRNSVILEEIYNGLGPVQDTDLRKDSIIYSGYSEPQSLTAIDELILRLLYHPDMKCGMNASQCEAVIRQLYY